MSTLNNTDISLRIFRDFSKDHSEIKVTLPGDEEWSTITECYIKTTNRPSVVARPQEASHVQELVKFCVSHNVEFVVRTGGHDCTGRSQVNGALTIDMRDIRYVNVSDDKATAQIGGGVITRELSKALDQQGLITPTAPNASVGHVGWAVLGGYGPLSNKYGLGVDQILGAKYVNAKGELVVAAEDELMAIRGGGGVLGVITEVTIKLYPLKQILEGAFVFESTNKYKTWTTFVDRYEKLISNEDFPTSFSVAPAGVAIPNKGNVFSVACLWADDDHEQGRKWMDKILSLGTCVMNMVKPNTWSAYCEEKEKLAGYGVYGRAQALNFKKLTPKTVEILAKYNDTIPCPGSLFAMYFHRDPAQPLESVFAPRTEHYWFRIIGTSYEEGLSKSAEQWALALKQELLEQDPENMLDSAYLGFLHDGEMDLKKGFGDGYETLMAVKKKVDPENVFKNTIPRL